jgi:hypothetical protein
MSFRFITSIKDYKMTDYDLKQEKLNEMAADMKQESYLRRDFEAFYDFTESQREEALEAVRTLENLYKLYGYEFDFATFRDEL